ncbi:type II toxin-antitoxin system YoeB family toxin [Dactylosporangium sp. NBC_01737]|uniref:type II toxin-antitoxin system YoeB family toxin n=1 Tax=Dactylosporangium sp. NBC_01737 TaxID=2975959 RepID=UPI002E0D2C6D
MADVVGAASGRARRTVGVAAMPNRVDLHDSLGLAGLRSRRIDDEHRLVYAVAPDEVTIISCRYHYQ